MNVMKTSLTIIPMCPRERFPLYKSLSRLVLCYKKDWATLLHFIYFCYLFLVTIYLIINYLLPLISVFAENTLLKTAYHFLLLLVGFDTYLSKGLQQIPYTCGSSSCAPREVAPPSTSPAEPSPGHGPSDQAGLLRRVDDEDAGQASSMSMRE